MLRLSGKLLHKHWRRFGGGARGNYVFQANVFTAGLTRRLENHCPVQSLRQRETGKNARMGILWPLYGQLSPVSSKSRTIGFIEKCFLFKA